MMFSTSHGEPYRHFSAIIGWKSLKDSVEHFGADHEFTRLITDLKGKDPDDAFSSVAYEKGFTFLFYLENLIGKEKFDKFIPHVCCHQNWNINFMASLSY
jgi:leukotriene-A4 hydrolase